MKKKTPRGDQGKYVRTGGAVGDLSMEKLEEFDSSGAGVSEDVKNVADSNGDPNAGVSLGSQPGAE